MIAESSPSVPTRAASKAARRSSPSARDELRVLLAKGAVSGAIVGVILFAAQHGQTQLAGVLVSAPVPQILTVLFIGWDGGKAGVRRFALFMLLGSSTYLVFTVSLYVFTGGVDWRVALAGSLVVWLVAAHVFMRATRGETEGEEE